MRLGLGFIVGVVAIVTACDAPGLGKSDVATGGTIVIAAAGEPDVLFPPAALSMEARQATELMYEYLADVGPDLNTSGDVGFVKELASSWRWSPDSLAIFFQIDPRAKWHDGVRVTADDVRFTYDVYSDSVVGAQVADDIRDIDSVTVTSRDTVAFWFSRRSPHQFFDAAAKMLILPKHLLGRVRHDSLGAAFARGKPIGSGRFRFGGWDRGSKLEVTAVEDHHRGRPGPDRIIWTITPEYETAVTRLLGGEADVFAGLRQETLDQKAIPQSFIVVTLPGMDYVFLQLNMRDPKTKSAPHALFASRDVRRAITMALDRPTMVKSLLGPLGTTSIGPAVRALPTTDTMLTQIPFDPAGAGRILDSLGWRRIGNDSIRSKNGKRLAFTAIVPSSSLSRVKLSVLMQEQFRIAGIEMKVEKMDYAAFSASQREHDFDAAFAAWHLGSSPGAVRTTWTSEAADKDGLNYGGYRNPVFDALVDSGLAATTLPISREYLRRANQLIVDDAPAVWLYEPKTVLGIHKRIKTTPMRANAWWLDMGSWKIPAVERLPRDAAVPPRQ